MTNREKIILKMLAMCPPGQPIWIPDLRQKFKSGKAIFDRAVLDAADSGRIFLQHHAYPAGLLPDDKKQSFIPDAESGGRLFYCAAVVRGRI